MRRQFLNIDQKDKMKDNTTLIGEIDNLKMQRNSDVDVSQMGVVMGIQEIKFLKIELQKLLKLFKKYKDVTNKSDANILSLGVLDQYED